MTEKRFKVFKVSGNFGEWEVEDTIKDDVVMDGILHKYLADRVCDVLNELNDENEQLKYDNTALKGVFDSYRGQAEYHQKQLEKENEQLKQKYRKLQIDFNDACGIVYDLRESKLDLEDENEQLKTDKMILERNHLPVMERKIEKYKMNVDALTETNDLLNEKIETLSDENGQLKSENKELKEELIEYIEQTSSDKPNKKGFVGNGRFA